MYKSFKLNDRFVFPIHYTAIDEAALGIEPSFKR